MDKSFADYLVVPEEIKKEKYFEKEIVVKKCESWNHFKELLKELETHYTELNWKGGSGFCNNLLFRGQTDANWPLVTSLERRSGYDANVTPYYLLLNKIRPDVVSCGLTNVPSLIGFPEIAGKKWDFFDKLESLEFMSFVRHMGFPTPILDWSRSVYVASFFAFQNCDLKKDGFVSVYALLDKSTKTASPASDKQCEVRTIETVGEYMSPHKRHFLQQSDYTYCVATNSNNGERRFCSYSDCLLSYSTGEFPQVIIFKFVIPMDEKIEALKELDKMNINAYSLYGSDEALMETLFNRRSLFQ